jgi:hypothetical protein
MFPNLERVELNCYKEDPMEALFYPGVVLGSTKLKEVTVYTEDQNRLDDSHNITTMSDKTQWEAFVNRILPFTHQLQKFTFTILRVTSPRSLRAPSLTRLCKSFSNSMNTLDIAMIQLPHDSFPVIASLPCLEDLSISVDDYSFGTEIPSTDSRHLIFPALSVLNLTINTMASGISFFRSMEASTLEKLDIKVKLRGPTTGEVNLSPLLEPLASAPTSKRLTELNIRGSSFRRNRNFQFTLHDDAIQILAVFKALVEFNVSPCAHHLTDEGLVGAFSSWKYLNHFSVHGIDDCNVPEDLGLSLAGVQRAIKHCPLLEYLALQCDFRELPPSSDIPPHCKLSHWRVDCSPITCGRSFSQWARTNLPNLKRVEFFAELRKRMDEDFDDSWVLMRQSMVYFDQWNDVPKLLKVKA